jgi:hypothetical protein
MINSSCPLRPNNGILPFWIWTAHG